MKGMIRLKKSPLIPKSMGAAEARKMLRVLNQSTLPVKPDLIAALNSRAKTDSRGGETNVN